MCVGLCGGERVVVAVGEFAEREGEEDDVLLRSASARLMPCLKSVSSRQNQDDKLSN